MNSLEPYTKYSSNGKNEIIYSLLFHIHQVTFMLYAVYVKYITLKQAPVWVIYSQ